MDDRDRRRRRQQERERVADEAFFDGLLLGHYMWHDDATGDHTRDSAEADERGLYDDGDTWDMDDLDDIDGMDDWD